MKTLKLVIELTYDDEIMHGANPEGIGWFYLNVLGDTTNDSLMLHSNEVGDTIGVVKVLEVLC